MTRATARFQPALSRPYAPWCVVTSLARVPTAASHALQAEVREHYDLERLWSDAPELDLGLPEEGSDEEGDAGGAG